MPKLKFPNPLQRWRKKHGGAVLVAVIFGMFGVYLVVASHAASPYAALEAESGNHTSPVTTVTDSNASGGSAIKFGSATSSSSCPASSFAFPCSISSNHRYLLDQNNNPFMIVGDSPHSLLGNVSTANMDTYFANRHTDGFNTALVQVICGLYTGCRGDLTTFDGIKPFTTAGDISTPNPAYFSRLDTMVQLAANHGITLILDPADTGELTVTGPNSSFLENNGVTKDFNYGAFLGNRYKNAPNVLWGNGNDYGGGNASYSHDAVVGAVSDGIRSTDPNHLQTIELSYIASTSFDDTYWVNRMDINSAYTYYATYDQVLNAYNLKNTSGGAVTRTNPAPVMMTEAHYEFEDIGFPSEELGSAAVLRRQEYWTMTSGATGQLYGSKYTWNATNWTEEAANLDSPGAIQIGYMKALFTALPWQTLVPDQSHTFLTAGFGTYAAQALVGSSTYATAGLSADGSTAVIYMPTNRTITVDMTKMRGATTTARWYDPTTGIYTTVNGSPITNSNNHNQTFNQTAGNRTDGTNDWVLVLQS